MKRMFAALCASAMLSTLTMRTSADSIWIEPVKMRVTCYVPTGNKTADGTVPYEGICAAKREWIGKTAIVYDQDMRYVGVFEIRDTGGAKRIKNGTSIDIFRDTLERCYEYEREHGMYGYVQIVEADG